MFLPVRRGRRIDLARFLVKNGLWVAVAAHRAVHRLPDIELLAGTPVRAEREFVLIDLSGAGKRAAQVIAFAGLFHAHVRPGDEEHIFIGIQIDVSEGAKVHRIGAGDERAVVMVWIKHLHGERFPTPRGTAVNEARPTLTDAAEGFSL